MISSWKKNDSAQLLSTDVLWERKWATRLTFGPDLERPTQREHCICSNCFHIFRKTLSTFVWQFPHLFKRLRVWLCCRCKGVKFRPNSMQAKTLESGWPLIWPMGSQASCWQHGSKWTAFDEEMTDHLCHWCQAFNCQAFSGAHPKSQHWCQACLPDFDCFCSKLKKDLNAPVCFDIPSCSKNRRREAADQDQDVLMHSTYVVPAADMDADADATLWTHADDPQPPPARPPPPTPATCHHALLLWLW